MFFFEKLFKNFSRESEPNFHKSVALSRNHEETAPVFRELFFFCTPQFGEFHKQDLFPEIVETHYGLQVIA